MKIRGYGWVAAGIAGLSPPATAVIAWQDSAPYVGSFYRRAADRGLDEGFEDAGDL